jgi:hypothetical protein
MSLRTHAHGFSISSATFAILKSLAFPPSSSKKSVQRLIVNLSCWQHLQRGAKGNCSRKTSHLVLQGQGNVAVGHLFGIILFVTSILNQVAFCLSDGFRIGEDFVF